MFISYLIYDEENPKVIEWCFVIEVKKSNNWKKLKDGTWLIPGDDLIGGEDFIGYYESDEFYAMDSEIHDTFNDACKDILREIFN